LTGAAHAASFFRALYAAMLHRPGFASARRAALLAFALCSPRVPAIDLILSPSHAASFYSVLERCQSGATLVNVDFHDDLAANRRTRELRLAWFGAATAEEGKARLQALRSRTGVACWNWIEPLMPYPVERAVWVAPPGAKAESLSALERKLKLGKRFGGTPLRRVALSDFAAAIPEGPWVLSIDLDYLSDSSDPEGELRWLLSRCRGHPPLVAVAAVSMPYLPSEARAGVLARALAAAVAAGTGWRFLVDPDPPLPEAIDRKRRDELRKAGREWKEYDPRSDGFTDFVQDGTRP
jgi:hypothetical protein